MNTFSDAEYGGVFVRLPTGLADRLVTAGRNHLQRQSRYVDPDADPVAVLEQWLFQLERARILPTPQPEVGDLLVKISRGETWMLTSDDWRELAPLELQTDPLAAARETLDEARHRVADDLADVRRGAGGVSSAKQHPDFPLPRNVGQILNDFPDAAGPPWPLFVQDVLDDLAERSAALHRAAEILLEDQSVAERDLVDGIRAYADGLDRGRKALLIGATEAFRPLTDG